MNDHPVLRRGARGDAVTELQEALAARGHDPGPIDGIFGALTEAAVRDFQAASGLTVDGVVGPNTWGALTAPSDATPGDADVPDVPEEPVEPVEPDEQEEPDAATERDWQTVDVHDRMRHVMGLLVERYGYPVNGAAGIVGNLSAESGVLPNRVEGSTSATPMRARDFAGQTVEFTAEEVMNRDRTAGTGPALPGAGLAQWTSPDRRRGLFSHVYDGQPAGADILFRMDAQVDYLNAEMRARYSRVFSVVSNAAVTVEDASDEVVYTFEVPGSILENGTKLPRTDPRVQETFRRRRELSLAALHAYEQVQP